MTDDQSFHLGWIAEGMCPAHGTPLGRRDDCGWCDQCGAGYSITTDSVSLHIEFNVPASLKDRR